jgi:hypothetical protein
MGVMVHICGGFAYYLRGVGLCGLVACGGLGVTGYPYYMKRKEKGLGVIDGEDWDRRLLATNY